MNYTEWQIAIFALAIVALTVILSGCSGLGGNESRVTINQGCDVQLSQHALVDGDDDNAVVEKVDVDKDCNVTVLFKQNLGDDV